jgi:hypothetical protein
MSLNLQFIITTTAATATVTSATTTTTTFATDVGMLLVLVAFCGCEVYTFYQ